MDFSGAHRETNMVIRRSVIARAWQSWQPFRKQTVDLRTGNEHSRNRSLPIDQGKRTDVFTSSNHFEFFQSFNVDAFGLIVLQYQVQAIE
jgi:hypothetical protein